MSSQDQAQNRAIQALRNKLSSMGGGNRNGTTLRQRIAGIPGFSFADGKLFKEQVQFWKFKFNARGLLAVLIIAMIGIAGIMTLPILKQEMDRWMDELETQANIEAHTSEPIMMAPTARGLMFELEPLLTQDAKFVSYFWSVDEYKLEYEGLDPDLVETGEGRVRPVAQITNLSYAKDVVGAYRARAQNILDEDLNDVNKAKIWTNTPLAEQPNMDDWYSYGDIRIKVEVVFYNLRGSAEDQETLSLDLPIYCYRHNPKMWNDDTRITEQWTYPETYVYIPFDFVNRLSQVQLTVTGEWHYEMRYQAWAEGGLSEPKQTNENLLYAPVTYYYPIEYPDRQESRLGGLL